MFAFNFKIFFAIIGFVSAVLLITTEPVAFVVIFAVGAVATLLISPVKTEDEAQSEEEANGDESSSTTP